MDAKITKSRLANFLSYDWLKILIAIVMAVAALCVFFTTVGTRPREDQRFELYCYTGLSGSSRAQQFSDTAMEEKIFSYDILAVTFETFDSFDIYGSAAYGARRAAGEGKAMFVPDALAKYDENGEKVSDTILEGFLAECLLNAGTESEYLNPLFDFPQFMEDATAYLANVLGENWRDAPVVNDDAVREIFLARNRNDKRYKTAANREKGIADERARFIGLRSDYLVVEEAIESGLFTYTDYTSEMGKTYTVALNIGGLARLQNFIYYNATSESGNIVHTAKDINFVIFNNGKHTTDLKYESLSLLAWLIEEYGE